MSVRCPMCNGNGDYVNPRQPLIRQECPRCHGAGSISMPAGARPCKKCGGKGKLVANIYNDLSGRVRDCPACDGKGYIV